MHKGVPGLVDVNFPARSRTLPYIKGCDQILQEHHIKCAGFCSALFIRLTRLKPRVHQEQGPHLKARVHQEQGVTKNRGPTKSRRTCNFLGEGDVEGPKEARSLGALPWVNTTLAGFAWEFTRFESHREFVSSPTSGTIIPRKQSLMEGRKCFI